VSSEAPRALNPKPPSDKGTGKPAPVIRRQTIPADARSEVTQSEDPGAAGLRQMLYGTRRWSYKWARSRASRTAALAWASRAA